MFLDEGSFSFYLLVFALFSVFCGVVGLFCYCFVCLFVFVLLLKISTHKSWLRMDVTVKIQVPVSFREGDQTNTYSRDNKSCDPPGASPR